MPALLELLGGVVPALALLGAILGWAVATGAIHIWYATFHQVFKWAAGILPGGFKILGGIKFPDLAGMVRSADVAVQDYLKAWRRGAELEIALSIHLLKLVWQAQAEAADWIATETAKTFDHLIHVRVPKVVKYAVPLTLTPYLIRRIVAAVLPHIKTGTVRVVHYVEHTVEHTATTVVRKAVGGAVAFPPWVMHLPRRVKSLEGDATRLSHRVRKLEGLLAASVAAGVLANVLGVATRCLRKGNLGRAARQVCGLDESFFNSLLGDLIAITSVLSVVEFATEMRAIEDEALKIIAAGVREWPS